MQFTSINFFAFALALLLATVHVHAEDNTKSKDDDLKTAAGVTGTIGAASVNNFAGLKKQGTNQSIFQIEVLGLVSSRKRLGQRLQGIIAEQSSVGPC